MNQYLYFHKLTRSKNYTDKDYLHKFYKKSKCSVFKVTPPMFTHLEKLNDNNSSFMQLLKVEKMLIHTLQKQEDKDIKRCLKIIFLVDY